MKWAKRGLIFNPSEFTLLKHARSEFAQSPQALVCEAHIRIYFSTREREENGKFLSHIAFVDFDREMRHVIRVSNNPVIGLGKLGCFDEHGIFPMNVVRKDRQIYAFTCGWSRRVSVPVETSIGLAVSRDEGLTFQRIGDGSILTSSLHEPCLAGDPFVLIKDGAWHMWYIYGQRWLRSDLPGGLPERVYKIGHAVSEDGVEWRKDGVQLIDDVLSADECQALPTVFEHDGRYHMYFCYRQATEFRKNKHRSYKIGYALSSDLKSWTRDDNSAGIGLSEEGWDCEMICYPHVFWCDGIAYMLYNGNEFGRSGFGLAVLE